MSSLSVKKIDALQKSISWSNRQLEKPRQKRIDAIKQFVGFHYSDGGTQKRVPVNMLALAIQIYVRQLAARAPRVMFTTKRADLKPTAANMELAINQIPDEIKLGATLQRMVTEAMFSPFGVVKCGLHTVGLALGHAYGQPFVDIVTLDDYFIDMSAEHADRIDYEGNDYWIDYDDVMESDWADKKALRDLKPDDYTGIGEHGEQRVENLTSNETAERFREKLRLRDVWLPKEDLLVTYAIKSKKVLNTVEWDGPERGPFHKLGFTNVPGCLLPLPPVALWRDIHELANTLFRKLEDQAKSQKSVLGFPGGNDDSVKDFQKASDGHGIMFQGGKPELLTTPGVDQTTLAFFMQTRDLGSYLAGNLDALGGLAPQTSTVGQDKLLGEAAGAQLRDMTSKTVDVVRDIFRTLAFYEWNDPVNRRTLEKPIPGVDMKIPVEFGPDSKKTDFDLYDLDIDVYSLQDDSPSTKLAKLLQFMERIVNPLYPMIQQVGGSIDVEKIIKQGAKYLGDEWLGEIVTFVDQADSPGASEPTGMPANTTRTTERIGRPGKTREGASADMQQLLMGANGPGGE